MATEPSYEGEQNPAYRPAHRHYQRTAVGQERYGHPTVRKIATSVGLILLAVGASGCTTKGYARASATSTSSGATPTLASHCPTVGPGPGYKVTRWPTPTRRGSPHSAQGCNLMHANLAGANLEHAVLVGADLSPANLTGADLRGAHLIDANLQNSNLAGTDLSGADLTDASLGDAILTSANLTGVKWSRTQCPDYSNSDADGGTCVGHETVPVAPTG
jgi:hypothetical protein